MRIVKIWEKQSSFEENFSTKTKKIENKEIFHEIENEKLLKFQLKSLAREFL